MKPGLFKHGCAGLLVLGFLLGTAAAQADAVWHCSRASETVDQKKPTLDEDDFQLAAVVPNKQAIGITLMDLMDVYSGQAILINGRRLTACFMPGNTLLSVQALDALGLKASTMQLQARKSAIVQSHLHMVNNEVEMLACIERNFPAVGYLSLEVQTNQAVSCF
jgi:hypothetical protein